jgi:hypothetical protein
MKKNLPVLFATLFISVFAFSQKPQVRVKKNSVLVEGKNYMTLRSDLTGTTFTDLEGNDLIYLAYNLESDSYPAYTKIIFLKELKMVTNQTLFISRKSLINMLITDSVLVDGKIKSDALNIFILKYNEEIPAYTKVIINSDN